MTASDRKLVEIAKKRIPMKKLLHGKEIREAMENLEKFRQQFNEQEFLYGAKVYVDMTDRYEWNAVCRRPETDKEYNTRMKEIQDREEARLAAEERKRIRQAELAVKAAEREERIREQQRKDDLEALKFMARKLGLSANDLAKLTD
jgi:hypothetical protein